MNYKMIRISEPVKAKLEKIAESAKNSGNPIRTQSGIVESLVTAAYEKQFT